MRGKISDQDLTDYALNELPPEDRLYVESMLAVSEECRHDVYQMIELGQMLEEGYEAEEAKMPAMLTGEQRLKVLRFERTTPVWQKAAAVVGLAASVAFAVTHPEFWQIENPGAKVAKVSGKVSQIVATAVKPEVGFAAPLANIRAIAEESSNWIPAANEVIEPMVCTPPSNWLEGTPLTSISEIAP